MPIFFQQEINADTRLGIWKIEEEAPFFLQKVEPQRSVVHPHKALQHLAGRYLLRHLFPDFPTESIRVADTRKPFLEDEAYHFSISHCGDYAAALVSRTSRVGVDLEVISDKVARIRHKFTTEEEAELIEHAQFSLFDAQNSTEEGYGQWSMGNGGIPKERASNLELQTSGTQSGTVNQLQTTNHKQQTDLSALGQRPTDIDLLTLVWSCKEAVFKWYSLGGVDFRGHIALRSIIPAGGGRFEVIAQFKKNEDLYLDLHAQFFDRLCLSYLLT